MLIGIVGKPNVGKSTFFKAATLAEVAIAPYPFTTIKANEGVGFVKVRCPEVEIRAKWGAGHKHIKCKPNHGYCIKGWRFIPVKLLDVAGLVPGAHLGKGLGNKFLDDLRQADVLIHIVDVSGTTDAEGKPTTGYDVIKEITFLQDEIDRWFYGIVGKNWKMLVRKLQISEKRPIDLLEEQFSGLKINKEIIKQAIKNNGLPEYFADWSDTQLYEFVRELRRLGKPMIIVANKVDLPEAKENLRRLAQELPNRLLQIIPCSAAAELALREAAKHGIISYIPGESSFAIKKGLTAEQRKALAFIEEILKKYGNTGVQQALNAAVFMLLNYVVVYPVENESHFSDAKHNVLPDALLMPPGSTALDLAYAIHSDIGKGFVAAIDARSHKRLAKDYKLKDGDIIRIMTS